MVVSRLLPRDNCLAEGGVREMLLFSLGGLVLLLATEVSDSLFFSRVVGLTEPDKLTSELVNWMSKLATSSVVFNDPPNSLPVS